MTALQATGAVACQCHLGLAWFSGTPTNPALLLGLVETSTFVSMPSGFQWGACPTVRGQPGGSCTAAVTTPAARHGFY